MKIAGDVQSHCGPALEFWQRAPRAPLLLTDESPAAELLLAALRREIIEFVYFGGSNPGTVRRVRPVRMFRVGASSAVYLHAFCLLRQEERTFRVDRLRLI